MKQSDSTKVINIHPGAFASLSKFKTYKQLNKYLAQFGLTRGERRCITRQLKNNGYSYPLN